MAAIPTTDDPIRRRWLVLSNREVKTPDRAIMAEVNPNDFPEYLKGLRGEGLIDGGERLTPMGYAFVYIGEEPGINDRSIWRRIGGSETIFESAIKQLIDKEFVRRDGQGGYVLAESGEG